MAFAVWEYTLSEDNTVYHSAGLVLIMSLLVIGLRRAVYIRSLMAQFRRQGLSFAPSSSIFGTLRTMQKVLTDLPDDVDPMYFPIQIRRHFPELGNVYYFDDWPFVAPILVVASPTPSRQVTQEHLLPKYPALSYFLKPIGGAQNLVTMEGSTHKRWRSVFNPGFSLSYILGLASRIASAVSIFAENLQSKAETGEIFELKTLTDNLTMDIIGKLVLDIEFNAQTKRNPMIAALRSQVEWLSFGTELNIFKRWNPLRPFVHAYNTWVMNTYLERDIQARINAHLRGAQDNTQKSILDRSIEAYLDERRAEDPKQTLSVGSDFKSFVIDQIKLFLFSGHDTTSTTLCYIFYFVWANPNVRDRLRAEHDQVLGPEVDAESLCRDPHIFNKLPFTLAVIKETLRLFPLSSSTRLGRDGASVTGDGGQIYPTKGCLVWVSHIAIQRAPEFWPEADKFIPDRWLPSAIDTSLHPIPGAWRPFEFGPRNCIGQELALLELKMALVFTLRRFDVDIVYDEWDGLNTHKAKGSKTVAGERAYLSITGGPSDGLPCRVRSVIRA